jgi:hypothetical protein
MSWVLIIYLFIEGTGPSSPNIAETTVVHGFQTEELCVAASQTIMGLAFVTDRPAARSSDRHWRIKHRTACIRQQ